MSELIGKEEKSYSELLFEDLEDDLMKWDKNGQLNFLQFDQKRIRRAGFYAEALLHFLFSQHPRFNLLAHNHQVVRNGRTMGELDFIFEDLKLNRLIHLELACKFYVQLEPALGLDGYFGINKNDTLGRKWKKMRDHQLCPDPDWFTEVAGLNGRIPETISCLKGRLFYSDNKKVAPELNPNHWAGKIIGNLNGLDESFEYCHKLAWISGEDPERLNWPDVPYNAKMFYSKYLNEWAIYKEGGF